MGEMDARHLPRRTHSDPNIPAVTGIEVHVEC